MNSKNYSPKVYHKIRVLNLEAFINIFTMTYDAYLLSLKVGTELWSVGPSLDE